MQQEQLFYDSAEEAVNAVLHKAGKPRKVVATELWPSMKMDSAYARLQNALNPDKPEKLTLDEIIQVCRVCEAYDPLYYMADELNHSRPQPVTPEDEQAQLMREFIKAEQSMKKSLERLERLGCKQK